MIGVQITEGARLGNIMFQAAAGASLARRTGTDFRCYASPAKMEYIDQFTADVLRNIEFITGDCPIENIYREAGFEYRGLPYEKDLCISGYFQSERYFDIPQVRRLFSIPDNIRDVLEARYPELSSSVSCSISVRRGDYLRLPAHHPVCGIGFYRRAINMMPADTVFYVCSDDFQWCRKHFKGERFIIADRCTVSEQLYLQSLCTHNIISNSTFGWWGAWLNANPEKKVIYPSRWFGVMYRHLDTSDLFPGEWISVDTPPPFGVRLRGIKEFARLKCHKTAKKILKSRRPNRSTR